MGEMIEYDESFQKVYMCFLSDFLNLWLDSSNEVKLLLGNNVH